MGNDKDPLANWHSSVSEIEDPTVLLAYKDAMEDVHTRFLLNLPPEELATADRILFQIEQAWWFYEDFLCDHQDTTTGIGALPRFKHLKPFAVEMFQFSPLLDTQHFFSMWETFSKYKRKISTYGCILLNQDCDKIVLCQDWNSKSWTFPAGKINQGEEGVDAAARETWEETGFDPNRNYGLTQQIMEATWKTPLQEKNAVSYTEDSGKRRTYYICHGVPEDFPFEPVVRKEVSLVQWHPLEKVPKKNFAVLPILPKVRRWIKRNTANKTKNKNRDPSKSKARKGSPKNKGRAEGTTPLKSNRTPNRKDNKSRSRSRGKGGIVQADDPLLETGLVAVGSDNRWTEEDMFAANEKILGRKVDYDGNPHVFSEQGFQGMDPHNFHIVGGSFLNSDTNALAPPPPASRLQHLFRTTTGTQDNAQPEGEVLTPFFSNEGATPWGEVVEEVKGSVASPIMRVKEDEGEGNKNSKKQQGHDKIAILTTSAGDSDLVFLTDEEITERSQKTKLAEWEMSSDVVNRKCHQDLQDVQDWVDSLPCPAHSKHFGEFKFNVDALMDAFYQSY